MIPKGIYTETTINGMNVSEDVISYSAELQGDSIGTGQPSSLDIILHNKDFNYNPRSIVYMSEVTLVTHKKSTLNGNVIDDAYPTFSGAVMKVDTKANQCIVHCEDQTGKYGMMMEAERSFKPSETTVPFTLGNISDMNDAQFAGKTITASFINPRSLVMYGSVQPTIYPLQKETRASGLVGYVTPLNHLMFTVATAVHLHWYVDGFLTSQSDTLSAIGYCNRVEVIGGPNKDANAKNANIVMAEGGQIKGIAERMDPLIPVWIEAPKYSDPSLTTVEACQQKAEELLSLYYEAFKNAETNPVVLGMVPDLRSEIVYSMAYKNTAQGYLTSCHIHTNRVEYGAAGFLSNITGSARSSNAELGQSDALPTNVKPTGSEP